MRLLHDMSLRAGIMVFLFFLLCVVRQVYAFDLVNGKIRATIYLSRNEPECVRLAVQDFISDVKKITGQDLRIVQSLEWISKPYVLIGTVTNKQFCTLTKINGVKSIDALKGKWESYQVENSSTNALVIAGSDARGTMFGIYDFMEQYLVVDPLYFWSGLEPLKKAELSWDQINIKVGEPTFKYRGWFINDEDLLTEWKESGGRRNIDYPFYQQVVAPEVMEKVVEAMVRSRFNLIIPASFLDIGNPAEEELVKIAARRGVFLSQHHIEPLGVNGFTYFNYWKTKNNTNPLFSYFSNKAELQEVWKAYAEKWAKYPNVIWQLGLRGIADRPMWMADLSIPQTDTDRGKIISDALKSQLEIIRSVDKRPNPPMTMTLWAEGSDLFSKNLLEIPSEAMIVFSDNCPGWKFQDDFYAVERKSERKYGIYYHHQLWGSGPHLAQTVSPSQTYKVLGEAIKMHSTEYAILNVSNVREFLPGIDASGKMLYDFGSFHPERNFKAWFQKRFPSHPDQVQKLYDDYFAGFVIHDALKVPMLMDGQANAASNKLMGEIRQIIRDAGKKPEPQNAQKLDLMNTLEKDFVNKTLRDMHASAGSDTELLQKSGFQSHVFAKVVLETEALIRNLNPGEAGLLSANFLSQAYFMKGLSQKLEYTVLAKQAVENGDRNMALKYLQMALECFSDIRKAKILATQGQWTDWYRGDKKMNFKASENNLEGLIKELH
ncbi:MAG: glycosyl hydrolase 115 family protein [Mariniphaga sp.]